MGTKAFTIADLHIRHGNGITRFRPQFKTMEEHDEYVIGKINETVNPTDSLYILGDAGIGAGSYEVMREIHCRNVFLIPGNHCGERTPIDSSVFKRVLGAYARRLPRGRLEAVFSHIPVHPQCLDRWDVNIHGHLHDQTIVNDPRYFCVSCEALDYTPIDMEAIYYRFLARQRTGELSLPEWKFEK